MVIMVRKLIRFASKCCFVLLAFIILFYVGIGIFGGFHLKSIPCAGGFATSLYQAELENIKAVCTEELTEEQLESIKLNLRKDRDNGKNMVTKYIDSNGEEVKLQCKMKWYWSGNYEWSIQ